MKTRKTIFMEENCNAKVEDIKTKGLHLTMHAVLLFRSFSPLPSRCCLAIGALRDEEKSLAMMVVIQRYLCERVCRINAGWEKQKSHFLH